MEPPDDDFLKKYSSPELDQALACQLINYNTLFGKQAEP